MNLTHLRRGAAALTVLTLLSPGLAACKSSPVPADTQAGAPNRGGPAGATSPMPAPGTCHFLQRNGETLPDPKCTPGSTNPAVTQATIKTTICQIGWTATIRPPVSVTGPMKKASARSYGFTGEGEYDHLISLELGGAPQDPANLWVEPGKIPNTKDPVENTLKKAVCAGKVSLTDAQRAIATDWTTALATLHLK